MVKLYRLAIFGFGEIANILAQFIKGRYSCRVLWTEMEKARFEMIVFFSTKKEPDLTPTLDVIQQYAESIKGAVSFLPLQRGVTRELLACVHRIQKQRRSLGSYPPCIRFRVREYEQKDRERQEIDMIASRIGREPTPTTTLMYHELLTDLVQMISGGNSTDNQHIRSLQNLLRVQNTTVDSS